MKSYQPYPQGQPQFYQPAGPQVMMVAPAPPVQGPVKDHLIWSVFNLVLLCPVLGLIAVIFSALSGNNKKGGMCTGGTAFITLAYLLIIHFKLV